MPPLRGLDNGGTVFYTDTAPTGLAFFRCARST